MLVCMGVGRDYSLGGHQWIFPKVFYWVSKVLKFVFYHSKFRKQDFILKFSNSSPSSDTHMIVCRKSSCHTIKKFR